MGEIGDMNRKSECGVVRADSLDALFPLLGGYGEVYLVCDRNVLETVGRTVADGLGGIAGDSLGGSSRRGRLLGVSPLDAREENKTMETVESIVSDMLEAGADRGVLVLGVGGGVTTDITGFAASVYKRGVRFAFVPTTLLAQADAAIGGKNGVNFRSYKNMMGTIRQPEFTFICPAPLRTLPREAFLCGVAEMLKTFIIADSGAYEDAVAFLKGRDGVDAEGAGVFAARAAEIKASIVERDPYERGLRRVLNLGHTFAHAMETLSGGRTPHGLAVASGVVAAARLAGRLSGRVTDAEGGLFLCQEGLAGRIEKDFRDIGLPTECPFSMKEMSSVMSRDKKVEGRMVNFILPSAVGDVRTVKLDAGLLPELSCK